MGVKITSQNKTLWKNLYETIGEFRKATPWQYYEDNYVFGVQDPKTGVFGWCTIMGAAEETFGLHVFIGDEGFESFLNIAENLGEGEDDIELVFSQRSISVVFVDKRETDQRDLSILKQVGYKPMKGRRQYISIRNFEPGMMPWDIDDQQAVFLTHCLEQVLVLVELAQKGEVRATDFEEDLLLAMIPEEENGELNWQPSYVKQPDPPAGQEYIPDPFLINRLRKELGRKRKGLFFSFQYLLSPVQEKKEERPFMPRLSLWADEDSGMILNSQIYNPQNLWENFQKECRDVFLDLGFIPDLITVDSEMGIMLLKRFAEELRIDLDYAPFHPIFVEIKESMQEFF